MTPSSTPARVQLQMEYRSGDEMWEESHDIPAPTIRNNGFTLTNEAGDFRLQGNVSRAQGDGTWIFVPNPAFARALQQRGVSAPSDHEQFALAISGFHIAELDALLAAGFERPSVEDLIRLPEHGVDAAYINAMKGLRFSPKSADALIRLRDHGVSPQFIARMSSHGYTNLTADDLIRLRDHGF